MTAAEDGLMPTVRITEHAMNPDPKKNRSAATLDDLFVAIAKEHLVIDTLATRGRDDLDFHSVPVWLVTRALRAAYDAGRASVRPPRPRRPKRRPDRPSDPSQN